MPTPSRSTPSAASRWLAEGLHPVQEATSHASPHHWLRLMPREDEQRLPAPIAEIGSIAAVPSLSHGECCLA